MTLLDEIKTKVSPEILATRNTNAITDALNTGRTRKQTTEIGNGLILSTIGMQAGNALLDVIGSVSDFRHVRPLLEQGRLDISTPLVAGALSSIVSSGAITRTDADALLALADVPNPVTELEVRCALWTDKGDYNA